MKPSFALQLHREKIREIVLRHRAQNARVFGSVVLGEDKDGSDLDILVDPTFATTLMDVAALQVELEATLGVPVDVLTPQALPDSFRSVVLGQVVAV